MHTAHLIVGGGPAGAAAAIALADAGRQVTLVEREAHAHDKVCGEFISHEAASYLAGLGIGLAGLGAVPIGRVRLIARDLIAEAALPFPALSLSRRRLDEALLARAAAAGATILRGRRVQALEERDGVWQARLDGGGTLTADSAFIASGKHDLRGWKRPAGRQNDLVAFKMHWRLAAGEARALADHVELLLFRGGYAGLEPIEDGLATLCLLVRRDRLRDLGGAWPGLLAALRADSPWLDRRLAGAVPMWPAPLALSAIPYGHVRRHAEGRAWRLGDQAAVIPSFAGDGVSIALHSGLLAARFCLAGRTPEEFQQRLARDVARQVNLATMLSRAMVRPGGQRLMAAAAHGFPALLRAAAAATRIPPAALARPPEESMFAVPLWRSS